LFITTSIQKQCTRPLRKTANAIVGRSSLSIVVVQPNKRLQTGSFCVGLVCQITEHNDPYERSTQIHPFGTIGVTNI